VSEAFGFASLVVYAPGGKTPMAGAAWPFFFYCGYQAMLFSVLHLHE
jgi:hypothetical protein